MPAISVWQTLAGDGGVPVWDNLAINNYVKLTTVKVWHGRGSGLYPACLLSRHWRACTEPSPPKKSTAPSLGLPCSSAGLRNLRLLTLLMGCPQITDKRLDQQRYTPQTSSQYEGSVDGKDLGPDGLEVTSFL